MVNRLDERFLEKMMVKAMLVDKYYLILICGVFKKEYFDNPAISSIFEYLKGYVEEYNDIPSRDVLINSMGENIKRSVVDIIEESNAIDFDIAGDQQLLIDQTNLYLKDQAIKKAIIESVDIIERNLGTEGIRTTIEDALCKDLKVDLGLDYFGDLGDRLRRIFTATDYRVPSYFPQFDELINGGFPPFTLSVLVARIHGFKSNLMANMIARQVLNGHDCVLMTLEMAQDAFAQRFDSIYSLLDINRMYLSTNHRILMDRLASVKSMPNRGSLFIKQFPTGAASVRDFRIYIRELILRGIRPKIIYVDYINLMQATSVNGEGMYTRIKRIAEELRALSFEFSIPVVSVSQLNREGSFVGFESLDFTYIAESMGIPATADLMAAIGTDDDSLVYESELHMKIIKNRLGGRVGEIIKFYWDARNLKMYDESEMDLWISDAIISGDDRNLAPERRTQREEVPRRGRR